MSFLTHAKLPTQEQINDQFTHGKIHQSLAYYNRIKRNGGEYDLGNLTQQWYGNNSQWIADVDSHYNAGDRKKIMEMIVGFLTTQPAPTPFTIKWSNGPKSITKDLGTSTIKIVGYTAPPTDEELKNRKE